MKRIVLGIVLAIAGLSLAGSGCFNLDAKAPQKITVGGGSTTLGDELRDLKRELDAGRLTQEEYERAKKKLIEAADKRNVRRDD